MSTILCYQSPRKNKKKIIPLKNTISNRNVSTREKRKSYKPSNRYYHEKPIFLDNNNSLQKISKSFYDFYLQKVTNSKIDKELEYKCALESITSFNNKEIEDEINKMNNKVLRLMGPSPRSLYVRKNIKILKTYSNSMEKECRSINKIKTAISENNKLLENNKRYKDSTENIERVFHIVTNDGNKFKLNPMRLNNPNWILSCLENYIGINK